MVVVASSGGGSANGSGGGGSGGGSGGWVQNTISPTEQNNSNMNQNNQSQNNKMFAKAILICRDNSHHFQERTLSLEQPVKIGRSVARVKAAPNNAIFDCKVLSRNHALLWYSAGKFYLQDTCSSNGTFVNNQRLSASGAESAPKEVCSGDIVQFGVDVLESTKKVTHGCIVATLKLYLPDLKEAKASLTTSVISSSAGNVSLEDLYKLNQVMQEASRREKALYSKLGYLQQLVENTRKAANQSWKALITEDRLLSWVVTVESQLAVYSKNFTEDKIRNELAKLQDEKAQYQNAAKEALQKILQEKLEVAKRLVQLEGRLSETEEECQSLHNVAKHTQTELEELSSKYADTQKKLQEVTDKLTESEDKLRDISFHAEQEKREYMKRLEDQMRIEKNLRAKLRDSRLDSVNIYKQITSLRNYTQTLHDMNLKLGDAGRFDSTKSEREDPIEAINTILNKLNSIHVDNIDNTMESSEINLSFKDDRQIVDNIIQDLKKKIFSSEFSFAKDQSDDEDSSRAIDVEYIVPLSSSSSPCRKTLINGNVNLENTDILERNLTDATDEIDECNSIVSSDDISEKSVIENNRKEEEEERDEKTEIPKETSCKTNVEDNEVNSEVRYYEHSSTKNDSSSVDMIGDQSVDRVEESTDSNEQKRQPRALMGSYHSEEDRDIQEGVIRIFPQLSSEDDYVNTLKPTLIKQVDAAAMTTTTTTAMQEGFHSNEYILQTLIGSLNSLKTIGTEENDSEERQIINKELEELKEWLIRESNVIVMDKLRELYCRTKNEAQRMQEVNEELVIVNEKYNAFVEEKRELNKRYMSLKAGVTSSYSIPIHYVAPIAIMLVWMLLEKIF